jgi:hypothetical protein
MNLFSVQIVSFLLVLILVEKASATRRGWKPSWDDDWGGSSSSSSSKSSKSSSKSSKSSSGGWGGWDDDDHDDWTGWKGWRGGGHDKKKKKRGWSRGEYGRPLFLFHLWTTTLTLFCAFVF